MSALKSVLTEGGRSGSVCSCGWYHVVQEDPDLGCRQTVGTMSLWECHLLL